MSYMLVRESGKISKLFSEADKDKFLIDVKPKCCHNQMLTSQVYFT